MTESLNFKTYFLFFCFTRAMAIINVILIDRMQAQHLIKGKKKERAVRGHVFFLDVLKK